MTISIDWGTKIIAVEKTDMLELQLNPFEIRELNLNTFRLALKALEASDNGMAFLDTHYHNPPVTVGGVTLARVIALINEYTVTFEDGQYAVNLVGANSNVADRVNVNQVSVRPSNSAGLIQTREIEHASFNDEVTIDAANGVAGTLYPTGTRVRPVNNLDDALLIAEVRGFNALRIVGDFTFGPTDVLDNLYIYGHYRLSGMVTVANGCSTAGTVFEYLGLKGALGGKVVLHRVGISAITGFSGVANTCVVNGPVTLGGSSPVSFLNCYAGPTITTIDMGGSGRALVVRAWAGPVTIKNLTGAEAVDIGVRGGVITLDSTIEAGAFILSGTGVLVNEAQSYTSLNTDGLVNPAIVADAVVDEDLSGHSPPQSLAAYVKRTAGLLGEYRRIKNIQRDGNGDLDTAEVHIYANEADYDADENATVYDADATFVAKLLKELGMKPR